MKLIWHDLLVFVIVYAGLSALYRNVLIEHEAYREYFELICIYASK
jgi:hypothetical protein